MLPAWCPARRALKEAGVGRIFVAAPVGSPSTVRSLAQHVDGVMCLLQPQAFSAVGQWCAAQGAGCWPLWLVLLLCCWCCCPAAGVRCYHCLVVAVSSWHVPCHALRNPEGSSFVRG